MQDDLRERLDKDLGGLLECGDFGEGWPWVKAAFANQLKRFAHELPRVPQPVWKVTAWRNMANTGSGTSAAA